MGSLSLLQGNLPDPGIEPRSPALRAEALTIEPPGKPSLLGGASLIQAVVASVGKEKT